MKKAIRFLGVFTAFVLFALHARATTVLTTNTAIDPLNFAFEGSDLVISNCTVTIDGSHSFNSLLVASGGVLTHSYLPSGSGSTVFAPNEPHNLNGTSPVTLLYSNILGYVTVVDASSLVTYIYGVDYLQTNLPDGTTQIYATSNSAIPNNANVLVSYLCTYAYNAGLYVTTTNDLTVAVGGAINLNGIGYAPGYGPGQGTSGTGSPVAGNGAGHGGDGGYNVNFGGTAGASYDSLYAPANLGSGGGASYAGVGASGGGLVQITSGGNVNIYGTISANGNFATNSRAGGGAGGGIWITATNFNGSGSLTANGGAGEPPYGGGGGGGRISIQCISNFFSGTLTAMGSTGSQPGGAGTVFTQVAGTNGLLVLDNGGLTNTYSSVNLSNVADVVIRNGARAQPSGSFLPNNLTIGAGSALAGNIESGFFLSVAGNLWIQSGGALSLDSMGYYPGTGTSPGSYNVTSGPPYPCGGAAHGGYGGNGGYGLSDPVGGGSPYDSETAPIAFGSGGGGLGIGYNDYGGSGGGALQLTVAGTLQVDGRLSANGGNGYGTGGGGGGAGGSIYISSCNLLAGAGAITANGGAGLTAFGGGGGGGGRIAIYANNSTFTGNTAAYGGAGVNYGGAGTIYLQLGSSPHQLLVDNGGSTGANTLVASLSSANLTVQNGGRALASGSTAFNNLLVSSNAWLTHLSGNSLTLTISGNATFQAGGGFIGDGLGHTSGTGFAPGANNASSPYYSGGGGGYGGAGGNSLSNAAAGGSYSGDTPANPSSSYSGSGGGGYVPSIGGTGGGFFQLSVAGTLQLDGLLTANGGNGFAPGGGGGAGGGISLNAGTWAGAGAITVNGGAGADGIGGGGGGGRIAVIFTSNRFTGSLSAYGGGGANYGGAGTIYFRTNGNNNGQVLADNAGHSGASTFWASSIGTDLTLRNGAGCFLSSALSFGNVIVSSNSWLAVSNNSQLASASVSATSLTIQPGGIVTADSAGYFAGSGSGAGGTSGTAPFYAGGGGGHGGTGGFAITNLAAGGTYFDTEASPSLYGGGGGGNATYSPGGRGGGNLSFTLTGVLQVDGSLSANGGNGSGAGGGGGAGGTLYIRCSGLRGAGTIAVNGGNGVSNVGGGGGGGMMYVNLYSNIFSGIISAYGGAGANYGGAGSIYYQTNLTGQTLLIVDNGGHRGTNTPMASANNWIIRNGAVAFALISGQGLNSLLIGSNGWLLASATVGGSTLNLIVNGNATIQSGGGIFGDGYGNPQSVGPGRGLAYGFSPYYQCSGAGHGGYGANGQGNSVAGGATYDSSTSPTTIGSGGGGYSTASTGGNGGGYIHLTVTGTLQLNGSITANGLNGGGAGGGGGSGGGIVLVNNPAGGIGVITGNGTISANGGSGANLAGGGGGGGRIAIDFNTNSFTGTVSAAGGGGNAYGGAGTIYTLTLSQQTVGQVLMDNGGNSGTNTTFDSVTTDVIIQNNAIGFIPSVRGWAPRNVFIHTNGVLVAQSSAINYIVSLNNLTIDNGGLFTLEGLGNAAQTGVGAGHATSALGGGGSHGGNGGGNPLGAGIAYDSIMAPVLPGSGGGNYVGQNVTYLGGSGGGALQLTVNGTLTVNGRLSANGFGGAFAAGGGSGGSLYFPVISSLAGSGIISASGGPTNTQAIGGGGGGGRISLHVTNNVFTGHVMAMGGYGVLPGGAGTIYSSTANYQAVTLDNGGLAGTNTPVAGSFSLPNPPFDLNISNGAVAIPLASLPIVNNLNLGVGGTLTLPYAQSNLFVAVKNNFNLAGAVIVDDLGYPQGNGPGSGASVSQQGAGASYGGVGGNSSSGAAAGITYGSASQPVDFGSGGGSGANSGTGGSEGGGAIRLTVGGNLTVNGELSANGDYGSQDNSGGGSGGSIWINASTFSGQGNITAVGGNGDLLNGGGGGGGRIAIYSPSNLFIGATNANGGFGGQNGNPGTIFLSSTLLPFLAITQSPTGIVNNTVSYADITFNDVFDPASFSAAAFTVTTPAGVIAASNVTAAITGNTSVRVYFPLQNLLGNYSVQVAPVFTNIFGAAMAAGFTGNFTISLPTISGTVADTNGTPVAGAFIQPGGGLIGAATDAGGNYSIGVPPGWNGTLTPSFGAFVFVPGSLTYSNVTTTITNQNFLMVPTIMPFLTAAPAGTNLLFSWSAIPGVTYQAWSSPDLVNWSLYGSPIVGTNGVIQLTVPVSPGTPTLFFRLGASN